MENEIPENHSAGNTMIPADLLGALDVWVTERRPPYGFQQVGALPDFARRLFPHTVSPGSKVVDFRESPFLTHFLEEAESFWRGSSRVPLKSDPWVESEGCDGECALEAIALSLGERRFLVIRMLGMDFVHRRDLLQGARESLLHQRRLEGLVSERTRQLALTQDATIDMLASLIETRIPNTVGHIIRTKAYVQVLTHGVREHRRFRHFLDDETIELVLRAVPLHDIGKIGVPDTILFKPGKLTAADFDEIKKHPIYAKDAILQAEQRLGGSRFLQTARVMAYSHHERWDGTGYPEGLRGEEIPIPARIMAVAEVYDALVTKRVDRGPLPHDEAVAMMARGKAEHFDPDLAEAFLDQADRFRRIASKYGDSEEERAALSPRGG